jgi:hypothetical protein
VILATATVTPGPVRLASPDASALRDAQFRPATGRT